MESEPRKAASSEAIPMPYHVSDTDKKIKKEEKIVNKSIKNKIRKRNKGSLAVENDDNNTKNVLV